MDSGNNSLYDNDIDIESVGESSVADDSERRKARAKKRKKARNRAIAFLCILLLLIVVLVVLIIYILTGGDAISLPDISVGTSTENIEDDDVAIVISGEETMEEFDPESLIPEPTYEEKLDELVSAAVDVMPIEDKVAGLFVVTPENITGVSAAIKAGDSTKEAMTKYAVGGFIYFGKNIKDADQIKEMISATVSYSRYPLFIAVDEEGGSISRLSNSGIFDKLPSAADVGATGDTNTAYETGLKIAENMTSLGFNLDFAPVADLKTPTNNLLATRSYGSDPDEVSGYVLQMMQGLSDGNVTSCVKHFPGIGSADGDTEEGMAPSSISREDLESGEFQIYRKAIEAGAKMIMVDHVAVPALTGDNTPCSLSKSVVTDILREEMDYDGVIISDALNMGAISEYYSSSEAAVMAIRAGCDMVLMPENFEEAYNGVLQAVENGQISEDRITDSLKRVYRIKFADRVE
ncbi:MAG: glycoside hydrolase family 3 protein [Acetatifactor sp.]|nr:glycoside hydrolase family 3 protein [Acetatifactor sp.]